MKSAAHKTESSAAALVACLERCRRREQLVLCGRYAWLAAAGSVLLAEILVVVVRPELHTAIAASLALVTAAVAAAVVAAMVATPTVREAAASVDALMLLDDRLVSALQFLDSHDAMSRLVVRDAAGRIGVVRPANVFPFEAPIRPLNLALVLFAVPLVLALLAGAVRGALWAKGGGTKGSMISVGSSAADGRGGYNRTAPGEAGNLTALVQLPTSSPAKPLSPSGSNSRPTAQAESSSLVAGQRSETVTQQEGGRTGGNAAPPTQTQGGSGRGGAGAGRGAGESSQATGASGGGTAGGPLATAQALPPRLLLRSAAYQDEYRTARERTQAAIAQERVPPRLRSYVMNYFIAIRPSGSK